MTSSSELRAGEWVEVRSKEEILQTLDENGLLEELPFMPEMLAFCGQRFQVFKRAHKTCDPPNGMTGRRMMHAVHLEGLRCNGEAHGGCQARCLIFWKDAWLKRADSDTRPTINTPQQTLVRITPSEVHIGCSDQDVVAATRAGAPDATEEQIFVCQSTRIAQATTAWHWWDLRQYVEDYTSGNVYLSQLSVVFLVFLCEQLATAGLGLGSAVRWIYNAVQRVRGGTRYPWRPGRVARGIRTPSTKLDVRRDDLVRVRKHEDILETIDERGCNRGMSFDAEMVPYCGGTYRVLDRIHKIINEKTGKLQHLKNDCIMLDGVVCMACYSTNRRFCPRSIYPYWREIWLERTETNVAEDVPRNYATKSTASAAIGGEV